MILANAKRYGFTIVELLIVVLIIGILTSVSIVAYNGVQKSARDTSVLSDMDAIDGIQTDYGIKNGVGGVAYNSANPEDVALLGFTPSSGNVIDVVTDGTDYCIRGYNPAGTKDSIENAFTRESTEGACGWLPIGGGPPIALNCPVNFIVVPGNNLFNTEHFCVMKYEAKNVAGIATSQADGVPWANIAIYSGTAGDNVSTAAPVACDGCRSITLDEWLTIAHDVLNVANNWSGGAVGNGYIYSGHNDSSPGNALAASPNDSDGYYGTGNSTGNQRRTLVLSNGEIIWDFAGNVNEYVSPYGSFGGFNVQPGVSGTPLVEWNNPVLNPRNYVYLMPSYGTPAAISWNSSNGIGQLYSTYSGAPVALTAVMGGSYADSTKAGVFYINMASYTVTSTSPTLGFRLAR